MNNILKSGHNFAKKYTTSYINALVKPFMAGVLGVLALCFIFIDTRFILIAIFSIPLLCYAFWKGYFITYGLIHLACSFSNEEEINFQDYIKQINEKDFAMWVSFIALLVWFYICQA